MTHKEQYRALRQAVAAIHDGISRKCDALDGYDYCGDDWKLDAAYDALREFEASRGCSGADDYSPHEELDLRIMYRGRGEYYPPTSYGWRYGLFLADASLGCRGLPPPAGGSLRRTRRPKKGIPP